MTALLRLENVGKSYGGVHALRGLSFEVGEGEIVGLMGANGAGKTTAFSLIAGTQRLSDGEIWFDGRRVDGRPAYATARAGIARTFQIVRPLSGLRRAIGCTADGVAASRSGVRSVALRS